MAMQEVRDRFARMEQKGISTKAACSEILASGIYTLVGALVITYAGTHACAIFTVFTRPLRNEVSRLHESDGAPL